MRRVSTFLRSPAFRTGFLVLAVAAAVWAVVEKWDDFSTALARLPWWVVVCGLLASFLYVFLTMLSWRSLLNDLGQSVPPRAAGGIFFTSQVAKYLPGGVWNVIAAAEVGVEYKIARRRSVTVLIVSMLVSVLTGLLLAVFALVFGPSDLGRSYGWTAAAIPLFVVLLAPPVMNRIVALLLRVARREPLERGLTWRGLASSAAWALAAWVVAGVQVWVLLTGLGMPLGVRTFLLATGGYALAWTVGFLIFFVPAGIGVREVVLGAVLAGFLDGGSVLAVVLLSRVFATIADIGWGVGAAALLRGRAKAGPAEVDGARE